ncbi:MAG: TerB family tellurite resistance protein [Sulfitobacter sp.]
MFGDFLRRLTEADPAPMADSDARLALTALLVRIARSDNDYAPRERDIIDQIAQDRYGLSAAEARKLRKDAESVESEAPDTVRFTRAIKDAVPYDDRVEVIEALWQVVLADGTRADEEDALLRMVSSLLGVTDTDSAMARRRMNAQKN